MIATVITKYLEQYGSKPTPEIIDELLRVEMEPLSEARKEAIAQEWQYVQATDLPEVPGLRDEPGAEVDRDPAPGTGNPRGV